jgi:hypothetical protein
MKEREPAPQYPREPAPTPSGGNGGFFCVVRRHGVWKVEYHPLVDIQREVLAGFRVKVDAQAFAGLLNQQGRVW